MIYVYESLALVFASVILGTAIGPSLTHSRSRAVPRLSSMRMRVRACVWSLLTFALVSLVASHVCVQA